jgi:hypothetical protein
MNIKHWILQVTFAFSLPSFLLLLLKRCVVWKRAKPYMSIVSRYTRVSGVYIQSELIALKGSISVQPQIGGKLVYPSLSLTQKKGEKGRREKASFRGTGKRALARTHAMERFLWSEDFDTGTPATCE